MQDSTGSSWMHGRLAQWLTYVSDAIIVAGALEYAVLVDDDGWSWGLFLWIACLAMVLVAAQQAIYALVLHRLDVVPADKVDAVKRHIHLQRRVASPATGGMLLACAIFAGAFGRIWLATTIAVVAVLNILIGLVGAALIVRRRRSRQTRPEAL